MQQMTASIEAEDLVLGNAQTHPSQILTVTLFTRPSQPFVGQDRSNIGMKRNVSHYRQIW